MNRLHIFSSESVGEGHPDKVADLISDTVVDACLAQDPASRVACETLVKDSHVILAGEITTQAVIDYKYYDPAEVEDPKLNLQSLRGANDEPKYCGETLPWKVEHEELKGSAFDSAVKAYYDNIYDHLMNGAELVIKPAKIKQMIAVMEEIHRQNPLPEKY